MGYTTGGEGGVRVSGGVAVAIVVLLLLEFQARFLSPTPAASDFSSSKRVFSAKKRDPGEKPSLKASSSSSSSSITLWRMVGRWDLERAEEGDGIA